MYAVDDYQWTERQINPILDLHLVSIILFHTNQIMS